MAEKAGWYPDPDERPDVFRWWTGQGWTSWLADNDEGPPPEGHDNPRITAVVVPRGDRQVSHTARTVVLAVLLLVVVLGLAAAGGAAVNRNTVHPDHQSTPSALTESPPMADAKLAADETTREVTFGDVSATLPEGQWLDLGQYQGIDPMYFSQRGVPQPSGNDEWVSIVGFGAYAGPPQLDLEGYANYLLGYMSVKFFGEQTAVITNVQRGELGDLPADRAISLTAEMRYDSVAGDAEFDWYEVIVIELNPGQRAVWFSAMPNNADQAVKDGVAASRESLRVN